MSDVHADHDPEALMDPADQWGTLGVHVVTAKGAFTSLLSYFT